MGGYAERIKKAIRSKQLKPVILQNPVQMYGATSVFMTAACLAEGGSAGNRALLFAFQSK